MLKPLSAFAVEWVLNEGSAGQKTDDSRWFAKYRFLLARSGAKQGTKINLLIGSFAALNGT